VYEESILVATFQLSSCLIWRISSLLSSRC